MIDINRIQNVYLVGIKGVGMTSLCLALLDINKNVSGVDLAEDFITESKLREIEINSSFSKENIKDNIDLVIYSAAHGGKENIEVKTANAKDIPTISYAKALQLLFQNKKIIVVTGTHGKTTTTSMLATILYRAGKDPSWIIGAGDVPSLPAPGHYGKGEYAIIEGDEYVDEIGGKAKFLFLNPLGTIITSLDWDHPDVYPNIKNYTNPFKKLIKRTKKNGILVLNGKIPMLRNAVKSFKGKKRFVLEKKYWHNLKLSIFGEINYENATYAATMAHEIGIEQNNILSALREFKGVGRRLEYLGKWRDWDVYDDYAHHPVEIQKTLLAVRQKFSNSDIVVVFQSHTYTRTQSLLKEFGKSFALSDLTLITPIFSSAREVRQATKAPDLLGEIKSNIDNASFVENSKEVASILKKRALSDKKVLIFMGAGDIYQWYKEMK